MRPEVGSVGKLFAALAAAERFLPGVGSHVSLQQPGPGEAFAAHITLVAEVVGENVHGQGGRAHVHLLADGARLGVLGGQRLVGLLVSGKVAPSCKCLRAQVARY